MSQIPLVGDGRLNFTFSEMSWARCIAPEGFNYNPENIGDEEFSMFMIMSMTEELGEMAGAFKKIVRGFNRREFKKTKEKLLKVLKPEEEEYARLIDAEWADKYWQDQLRTVWLQVKLKAVAKEAADLVIYLDLFLSQNKIDLFGTIKEKFNQVSNEMGCPQYQLP